ncbi:acyl-coenzyme A synthetase/AMP-(fatty) acid ligase [Methylohalomonas lacus]|uniref:Acyl-coenzyme A synthetase/AMP-(Fatty) acid ligase n=1 Tax=Methylohalomonas lacus TaxID=398773 RepID=A0AAE3L1P1_9GAMM|nr:long-chain fatty acid--CoA ligase [Methylohalomonas lacus]MCS3904359.1 acyl-coenzyme A synthetase/AMP-(fatty) acid ligase [Methylohalomonas lacus]
MIGSALPWYEHWAADAPADWAVVTPSSCINYADLLEHIVRQEQSLSVRGYRRGDRLLHADRPGTVDWIVTLLAGLGLGLQVVLPDEDWPEERIPLHTGSLFVPDTATAGHTPAGIWLFTSGTTAVPKPRLRTLAHLRADIARVHDRLPATIRCNRPASLCLLPLSHGFGLLNSLLSVHAFGGTAVIEEIGQPQRIAAALHRYPVQVLYSWPAHLHKLSDPELWQQAAAPLLWCVSSSLRLTAETARAFAAASGCPVRQQYGTTETGPLCVDGGEPPADEPHCMGTPLNGVEVRVLDADGRSRADGQAGELAVRLAPHQLPDHELTADGFWPTGDHGCLDRHGRVHVLGRYRAFTDERRDDTSHFQR